MVYMGPRKCRKICSTLAVISKRKTLDEGKHGNGASEAGVSQGEQNKAPRNDLEKK